MEEKSKREPSVLKMAEKLMRSGPQPAVAAGANCYIPNAADVFEEARIESLTATEAVAIDSTQTKRQVALSNVYLANPLGGEGVEDMVLLQYLHEPAVIANLELRFYAKRIYTYIGSILISMNPYKNVPIYTPAIIRMYENKPVGSLPPHIYALGDAAYYSAVSERKNQAILISGESGAGKTEATKLIINYLTVISARDKSRVKPKITPKDRIVSCNPILEAFGNAKTLRNNNSSRFAKMIDVQLDRTGYIVGGKIKHYLLEKSRVVRQNKSERNFHAFYYLLAGCDKTERAVWGLYDAKHYRFTNQTRVYEIKDVNSKTEYVNMKRNMTTGGISVHNQHLIFTLLAAVLHLGNIQFEGDVDAKIKNMEVVKWVAHLLKCDVKLLQAALLTGQVRIADELMDAPLTPQKARDTRDTFAKELYSRNFQWIVSELNRDMESKQSDVVISLLDIFGFEQYERNAFEQFCINYANERLQYLFNENIFMREKAEYIAEKIQVSDFTFVDNQPALDLIEKIPNGLLAILDEETKDSSNSDFSGFLQRLLQVPAHKPSPVEKGPVFNVTHYAGDVTYDASLFLETNREHFSTALLKAIKTSRISYFAELFPEGAVLASNTRPSVSAQFKEQLIALMKLLGTGVPQYVRCLRPNPDQSSETFDRFEVLRQLRCAGVLETVRIRKEGYPHRTSWQDFLARFDMLAPPGTKLPKEGSPRIVALMASLSIPESRYRIGISKVFLKDETHHKLEGLRNAYYNKAAVIIQASIKGYAEKCRYKKIVKATALLQKWIRLYLKAMDCSAKVDENLKGLNSKENRMSAVESLGNLADREANVDTIIGKGGVSAILDVIDKDTDSNVLRVGAQALGKMTRTTEHSTSVARAGAVASMARNLNQRESMEDQASSAYLLGDLAREEKNSGIFVREGAVEAVTTAMRRNVLNQDVTDTQSAAPAAALGNLTRNRRAAQYVGRDHSAIKAVIDGMIEKPKFAKLTEYSISCLANMAESRDNVDSFVELRGIEATTAALQNHYANEDVVKEVSRTWKQVAANPHYAKMIGDRNGVEMALNSLRSDPEHVGEHALSILQSLCSHPANTSRLLKSGGLQVFLQVLKSDVKNERVLTSIMRMLNTLCQDPAVCQMLAELEGAKTVLESLVKNPTFMEHNKNAILILLRLGTDKDSFDYLKSADLVNVVAQAMERHSDDPEFKDVGKSVLLVFADRQDLETAMDIVARSRMKSQTDKTLLETGAAIVTVAALAVIEPNIEYIIQEGGIPVLLAVVNGISVNVTQKIADAVLVPAIRALTRVINSENNIEEFISEGGVASVVGILQGQSDKERVCDAAVLLTRTLVASNSGYTEIERHQAIEAINGVLLTRAEFQKVVMKVLSLYQDIAQSKAQGTKLLVDKGSIEALLKVIQIYQNKPDIVIACSELLQILMAGSNDIERRLLYISAELMLVAMRNMPENADLALSCCNFITKLCPDQEAVQYLQDKRAGEVILMLLDHHYGNMEVTSRATEILGYITGNKELMEALDHLRMLNEDLKERPSDVEVMHKMLLPITLLGSMAANEQAAAAIIDARGFETLDSSLKVVEDAKSCPAQERLFKHIAVAISRLGSHRPFIKAIMFSGTVPHLMDAVRRHVDYEDFVEEAQQAMEIMARNSEAVGYLIDSGAAKTSATLVNAHPLNDTVLLSAVRFVTRLARGADAQQLPIIRRDGSQLAFAAVNRFMNAEDHIIEALTSVARLATITTDGSYIAVPRETMSLLQTVVNKHKNSPTVMTAASSALAALAEDPNFARSLVLDGLIDDVIRGLETYGDNEDYCTRALAVLNKVAQFKENHAKLDECGVPNIVLETLARHMTSESVQVQGFCVLKALAGSQILAFSLGNNGALRQVFNGVRAHPLSPAVVMNGVAFSAELARFVDLHEVCVTERTKEMVSWAMRAYPQNVQLQSICRKTLQLLVKDPEEQEALMMKPDKGDDLEVPSGGKVVTRDDPKVVQGLVSVMNVIKTPESDSKQLASALINLSTSKASQEVLDEMVKHGGLARLVALQEDSNDDLAVLLPTIKSLGRFAEKPEHINLIVAYGGIGALLRAMKKHMGVPDVLSAGIKLLGKLSAFNRLKVLIGLYGGIPVILEIMERYLTMAPLLNKCCYCLGNLASNCLPNRKAITTGGGVNFISYGMQKHRSFLELVINSARALSPLCADSDPNRVAVAKGGGSLIIITAIKMNPQNPALLQNGLNCLHKISKATETLPTLIHQGGVQAVVAAMNAYPENTELQQFGMEILSNLSAYTSRETAGQLTRGGTIEAVIRIAILHQGLARIQIAAFTCLQHLATASGEDATLVVHSGFVPKILESIATHDAQEKILLEGIELLTVLSSNEINARDVVDSGAPEVLVRIMRAEAANREVMKRCLVCLSKLSTTREHASILAARDCVVAVIAALMDRNDDANFLTDVLRVMVNLAILETNAITISETAIQPLIKAVDNNFTSQPFLRMFYLLMNNLSMWPRASKHLIEHGMIPIIMDTIKASVNYPAVLVKMIKTLTNFTLVGESAKRQLISDGALSLVKEMMVVHASHIQLMKAAELFVQKVTGHKARDSIFAMPADFYTYVLKKIPEHTRNLLTSGEEFKKHSNNRSGKRRFVKVSLDFMSLVWSDPKNTDPKNDSHLPFRFVKEISAGLCTPHLLSKILGFKKPNTECSFALFDLRSPGWALSLEAKTPQIAAQWVAALQLLKDTHLNFSVGLG